MGKHEKMEYARMAVEEVLREHFSTLQGGEREQAKAEVLLLELIIALRKLDTTLREHGEGQSYTGREVHHLLSFLRSEIRDFMCITVHGYISKEEKK